VKLAASLPSADEPRSAEPGAARNAGPRQPARVAEAPGGPAGSLPPPAVVAAAMAPPRAAAALSAAMELQRGVPAAPPRAMSLPLRLALPRGSPQVVSRSRSLQNAVRREFRLVVAPQAPRHELRRLGIRQRAGSATPADRAAAEIPELVGSASARPLQRSASAGTSAEPSARPFPVPSPSPSVWRQEQGPLPRRAPD